MQLGLIGLGKMGGNMAERVRRAGHEVVGYDHSPGKRDVDSLEALVEALDAPRVIWVMVPSGEPTRQTVKELGELLSEGDVVVDGGTPLRCEFTPGQVTLRAGGTDDEGQAEERCDVEFDGEPLTIGFNPTFLLDGLAAVHTPRARMDFTSPLKPAVLSGFDEPSGDGDSGRPAERPGSYRYLIMPVRLPG